jgi:2-phosphosulfolactate phosphatase
MLFSQIDFDVRCEWGKEGIQHLITLCDAIIVVDVLSFCTCVDIAVSRQAVVYQL